MHIFKSENLNQNIFFIAVIIITSILKKLNSRIMFGVALIDNFQIDRSESKVNKTVFLKHKIL